MYPYLRMAKEIWKFRNAPALPMLGMHVSHHICWPQDIDPWAELNNGRTLTLFDLGRIPLGLRTGIHRALRAQGWRMAVAGSSVRYRRRVRIMDRLEMRSHCIGWDARFIYMEQGLWRDGECTSHILLRSAVTAGRGLIAPQRLVSATGLDIDSPPLPHWVKGWIEADALRPWPPEQA
ncbi:MAG: acyl-CoA thioesterase [Pseudorhodobacter sp.]